jgi:hypothetical protein
MKIVEITKNLFKVIVITFICISTGAFGYKYIELEESRAKAEIINNCFKISEYSKITEEFITKEPIEIYFKTCMQINGFNPD